MTLIRPLPAVLDNDQALLIEVIVTVAPQSDNARQTQPAIAATSQRVEHVTHSPRRARVGLQVEDELHSPDRVVLLDLNSSTAWDYDPIHITSCCGKAMATWTVR